MKKKATIAALILAIAAQMITGCAHRASNKVKGEVVRLTLRQNEIQAHAIEAAAAGALVGVAIDLAKAKIEAEAKKLERQYGQFDYRSDFWDIKKNTNTVPPVSLRHNYSGFTLQRFTKEMPESKTQPAMTLECSFEPSENGRMFLIKPVSFELKEAKAKIVNRDAKVNVSVNVAVDAMWIDAAQVAHQERIAFSTFEIMDYDLSKGEKLTTFAGQRAGWFPGVPISRGVDGKFPWETGKDGTYIDGCFKLSVLVTERDASKAKQYLEKAAKFIGDQKDKLVEKAKEAAGE